MSQTLIEAARPADVPDILRLIRALAEYEHLAHEVVATEALIDAALFCDTPRIEALIARVDGRAVGFALFFHNFSTFLGRAGIYLEDLFVEPEQRGRGLGRALLRHIARLALDRGCGRFEWSVLDWNEPSIRFYEALGARVMPDWRICRLTGEALEALAGAS